MSGLRDHLQAIYDQNGRLTPSLVVEAARHKDHPLHARVFDRAPAEAAEAWWLHRARELIVEVRIVYKTGAKTGAKGVRRDVRAFHAVRTEDGNVYEPAETIAADSFLREMLLRDMEREWKQMRDRYKDVAEFFELVRASLGEEMAA